MKAGTVPNRGTLAIMIDVTQSTVLEFLRAHGAVLEGLRRRDILRSAKGSHENSCVASQAASVVTTSFRQGKTQQLFSWVP